MEHQTPKQTPSIGRAVHYFNDQGIHEHATIIDVHTEETVTLLVCNRQGTQYTARSVQLGTGPARWNWPARV